MTRTELIDLIEAAQANWDSCDWTHEARDLDGEIQRDEDENAIMCEGGNEDECATCRAALKDAQSASELGDKAIKALRSGDIVSAKEHAVEARDLEDAWGDCPAWRPATEALESIPVYDITELTFHVPPANGGQIVEVSYASVDGEVICRTHDRSDRSMVYEVATCDEDDEGDYWNHEPNPGGWQLIGVRA